MSWSAKYQGTQQVVREEVAKAANIPDQTKRGIDELLLSVAPEQKCILTTYGHLSETREGYLSVEIKKAE